MSRHLYHTKKSSVLSTPADAFSSDDSRSQSYNSDNCDNSDNYDNYSNYETDTTTSLHQESICVVDKTKKIHLITQTNTKTCVINIFRPVAIDTHHKINKTMMHHPIIGGLKSAFSKFVSKTKLLDICHK